MFRVQIRSFALLVLSALLLPSLAVAQPTNTDTSKSTSGQNGSPSAASSDEDPELKELRKKVERLRLQNELFKQKLNKQLHSLKAKLKRQKKEFELLEQKQKSELSDLSRKKEKLQTQAELSKAKSENDLSDVTARINKLKKQLELAETRARKSLQKLKKEKERLNTELDLKKAKKNDELAQLKLQLQEKKTQVALEEARAKHMKAKLTGTKLKQKLDLAEVESKNSRMEAEIDLRKTRAEWKKEVNSDISYLDEPLQDKTLYLTDRRIKLNGPIISKTGKWVSKRINYFNNRSEKHPIFIVINDSPGGSVMAGMHILKTMKSTEAPVYVVVKERAFSMAAAIATLADRSFAYPDALLLHHEIQASMGGSLTETEESLEMMKRWWHRIAQPIANKMEMELEEFREQLYEENSNGNWKEFATKAQELNWVDHIVNKIEDAGVRTEPDEEPPSPSFFFLKKEDGQGKSLRKDDQGRLYRKLPPLRPYDFYYMYNPNDYYRW